MNDECPNCGQPTTLEEETEPDGYRWCEYCGWTDRPACVHGILEGEFCVQCPGGGV